MKRIGQGVVVVLCYVIAYWIFIGLWSFTGFSSISSVTERIDAVLRATAIPFLLGVGLAFVFRQRLQLWALAVAPFASSAVLLVVTGMDWREIQHGVLGFWVISAVAACAATAGGVVERRAELAGGRTVHTQ
jgi:hypothetical protein